MERFENKLTPSKIMRLLQIAESATPQVPAGSGGNRRRVLAEKNPIETTDEQESVFGSSGENSKQITSQCSVSTGILDLNQYEGFGESAGIHADLTVGLSISTGSFHPGEMTGRSTGATDAEVVASGARPSAAIDELAARMRQQSCDVAHVMRQSVCQNYSFVPAELDLTRDEMSFVCERGDLPVPASQINLNLTQVTRPTAADTTADMSVGSYFMKGSQTLANMIGRSDSPQYGTLMEPSLIEADSRMYGIQPGFATINDSDCVVLDNTLDRVPTRQPREVASTVAATVAAIAAPSHKAAVAATALCAPQLQHLNVPSRTNEDSLGMDASLSISLIAKCLGKYDSNVTPSMLLEEAKQKKKSQRPQLMSQEIPPSLLADTFVVPNACRSRPVMVETDNPRFVATLKQHGRTDTASSSGSVNTIINVPTKESEANKENICNTTPKKMGVDTVLKNSKQSFSVQENRISTSNHSESMHVSANEKEWVNIEVGPVEACVGVCTGVIVKLTSVSESFLSARLQLDDTTPDDGSVAVDIPRLPVLLKPRAPELLSLTITAFKPISEVLNVKLLLTDTCDDVEMQQDINLSVKFTLPKIEILTAENSGSIVFSPTSLDSQSVKSFILTSDSRSSLQLSLSVEQNCKTFSIGCIQEIRSENVQKHLSDHRLMSEEELMPGAKYRAVKSNVKQVCVLSKGCALRVVMLCKAPPAIVTNTPRTTLNGCLRVHLVGTNTLLQKIPLSATIGTVKLMFNLPGEKLLLTKDKQTVEVKNVGTISGAWRTCVRGPHAQHFTVEPALLEVPSGTVATVQISHGRQKHTLQGILVLENVYGGGELEIEMATSVEKFTHFPIKTTKSELSWVREGRRDVSMKNTSDRRLTVRCKIYGEGFKIENTRQSVTDCVLTMEPSQCYGLSIFYNPKEKGCHHGKMAIMLEQDSDCVKSVRLNGQTGARGLQWAGGVVTCGDMGIVFVRGRGAGVSLALENKGRQPAFYSARLLFNLQYRSVEAGSRVTPARGVVPPLGSTSLSIDVDWGRLNRLSETNRTLASLFILTGPEMCRRRILRIMKNCPSSEPSTWRTEELARLTGVFAGEDPALDRLIEHFDETQKSLPVLLGGIQELTAQIELNKDSVGESTVILSDDTCVEHHTLID